MTFTTGVSSEIPYSSVFRYLKTSYLSFIAIQLTGCNEIRDLSGENAGTDYQVFSSSSFA